MNPKMVLSQDTSRVEWIKIFFNMPADTSIAKMKIKATYKPNLVSTLTELIDSAKYSVDLCVYDIEHLDLAHSLANAKTRGLRVRVVTDDHNRTDGKEIDEAFFDILRQAGIYSIDDDGDIYTPDGRMLDTKKTNSGAHMHHKFAVLDFLSPNPNDDIVWTGSTNMTYTGNFNTNNTIQIKDSKVAETYTKEFEVMWGGSDEIPNQKKALFHKDKPLLSSAVHFINDIKVEIYFSPIDRKKKKRLISSRIVDIIKNEAQHDVQFSAFSITPSFPISKALWALDNQNIKLVGVISSDFYSRYRKQNAIWALEVAREGNRMVLPSNEMRKLHHKTIIIDENNPNESDIAVTITGSYNFSNNADKSNDENILFIYSDSVAHIFSQDMKGIQNRANGTWNKPLPPIEKNQSYTFKSTRDPNHIEIEIVPGFRYPIYIAGVNAPYAYRGKDSTTFYASEAMDYIKEVLRDEKIELKNYKLYKDRLYAEIFYDRELFAKRLIDNGFATHKWDKLLSENQNRELKELQKKAKQDEKGFWRYPDSIFKTIATNKKSGFDYLIENPLNINKAAVEELVILPGIGPSKANKIVSYREMNGNFKSINDLKKVKGIGQKTVNKLRPYITVD